jgi:hypothetical protein
MSPWIVTERLESGYSLEEKLRDLYHPESESSIGEIINIVKAQQPKEKPKGLVNRLGQRLKMDPNNIQDKNKQRVTNYINRYIREKQSRGELPRVIDSIIRDTIIKDEALHTRAQLDLVRAQRINARGPYQVKITYSSKVKFIRAPWKQNPKISKMILNYMKKEQQLLDVTQIYEREKKLYAMETTWEKLHHGNDNDWSETIVGLIRKLQKDLNKREKFFKRYADEVLPEILPKKQKIADRIHERGGRRLGLLVKESEGVTPFESLLGKETLRELVRKYKYES